MDAISIWERFKTPDNVRRHCKVVSDVASFLAFSLKQKGIEVDVSLVEKAGLVHDALKQLEFAHKSSDKDREYWLSLKEEYAESCPQEMNVHEYAISRFFSSDKKLSDILKRHGYEAMRDDPPRTWEEKLVNYADKRVMHAEIVSLKERFDDGHKRYGNNPKMTSAIDPLFFGLEKEIFSKLDFGPDQLKDKVYENKLIIFDYDGVIIDSLPVLFKCHKETCIELGIEPPFSNFKEFGDFFFVSWNDGVDRITNNDRNRYWEVYRKKMLASIPELKVFKGIKELLLRNEGKILCIVSDSRERYVLDSLEKNGIKNHFNHIIAGKFDDKPNPSGILECISVSNIWKTNTIYVGDMNVDIEAARNANVRCIAVSYGYHEKKHLNSAYKVVNSVEELSGAI